jgi:hypothetical protein
MASIQFGWDDLWNFYENTSEEVQKDILQQLSTILKSCTEKMKQEVLKHAPEDAVSLLWEGICNSWSNQEIHHLFNIRR